MSRKNTIPIVFHGGGYGTYLEWCLTVLTSNLLIYSPFKSNGNSHGFNGNHLHNMAGWRQYVNSPDCWDFVRLHPKRKQSDSIQDHLDEISNQVNLFVYLYLDHSTLLLVLNNQVDKVGRDWWDHSFENGLIDINKIYSNWPVDPGTPIKNIPNWIKREFLSHYLMPAWFDQIGWFYPEHHNQPNCLFVPVNRLLHNIEDTVGQILDQSGLALTKSIDKLLPVHDQMIGLQKNINQDQLCKKIIQSVNGTDMLDWGDQYITLVSESYIQWQLRNLGYELRCHGLDMFPTNSVQLKELLYTV
jgi:hypothetical protein